MSTLPPLTQLAGNHGTLFEGYFQQLDVSRNGRIDASSAAAFLKKSQLVDPVLHKIWELSDPNGKGYLDRQGFYAALRMVAACQMGREASLSVITLSDPPPRLVGVDSTTIAGFTQKKWIIEAEDKMRYDKIFQSQSPVGGKLSGDKARQLMMASKLPVDALGKIWNLSDIDRDGHLDGEEFAVAMRLIQLCQAGEVLPAALPPSIIPPSKRPVVGGGGVGGGGGGGVAAGGGIGVLGSTLRPSPSPSPSPATPTTSSPTLSRKQEWVVSQETKAKYDGYFAGIDKDKDGYVTGEESRSLFMASNLSHTILAHIWNMCDIQKKGRLNGEQFALAMYLIAEKVRGKELPTELTPNMIPPSLRGKSPPSGAAATPTSQVPFTAFSTSISSSLSASSLTSVPGTTGTPTATSLLPPSSSTSSIPLLPTVSSNQQTLPSSFAAAFGSPSVAPVPKPAGGDTESGPAGDDGFGFGSDFSAIKELDTLTHEITSVKTEKVRLQEDIRLKQELIKTRKEEIDNLQEESGSFMKQREELEREKGQHLAKLEQLDAQKAQAESQIAEMKQKCQHQQEEIERLKAQFTQQESSRRAEGEELESLKVQLEALKKEEREYKQRVENGRAELEKLQKANQNRQSDIKEVRSKIDRLKEEHVQLNQQITMYSASGSTPGSTPSSSVVNINDVGQLPVELHVPHISEPDAVSARATAGSSSPVSSISGFSTNSHLEETTEDSGVGGGGGKEDRTPRNDPFASSSGGTSSSTQANDPFAAFSVPGNDHFSIPGENTFNSTGFASFDPFGMVDAFKSSASGGGGGGSGAGKSGGGASVGDDLFKTDPFSSSTAATSNGGTTDPFSGQDPFSSDPFASVSSTTSSTIPPSATSPSATTSVKSSSSPWSGGGGGGNSGSTSLFGSDPFGGGGGGGGISGGMGGGQTATTPTDPFASDPFMEDPFGVKSSSSGGGGGGGEVNPFGSGTDVFGSKGWSDSKKS